MKIKIEVPDLAAAIAKLADAMTLPDPHTLTPDMPLNADGWVCSAFRNEGAGVASELIRDAVAATLAFYGSPPELGMVTFIDRKKVKPTMVHGTPTWGRTYALAGFEYAGETKGGLLAMQLRPENMPAPKRANI